MRNGIETMTGIDRERGSSILPFPFSMIGLDPKFENMARKIQEYTHFKRKIWKL